MKTNFFYCMIASICSFFLSGCGKADFSTGTSVAPQSLFLRSHDSLPLLSDTVPTYPQTDSTLPSISPMAHCGCLPIISISHENGFPVIRFPVPESYRHANFTLSYTLNGSTGNINDLDPGASDQILTLPCTMGNQSYELSVTLTCQESTCHDCKSTTTFSYAGSSGGGTITSPGDCGRNYTEVLVGVPQSGQAIITVYGAEGTGNTDMVPDLYEIFSQDRYGNRTSYRKGNLSIGENTISYPNSASSSYLYLVKMYGSACGDHEKHFLEASLSVSPNTWPAVETNNH